MDEEKRIITLYPGIDYDGSVEKLKKILSKFNATLKSATDEEYQVEIAKSMLEDFCDELDLDIDDLTEEWDAYVAPEQKVTNAVPVAITSMLKDFDVKSFFDERRQDMSNSSCALDNENESFELYVDVSDKVYVELYKKVGDKPKLLYERSFEKEDAKMWDVVCASIDKFFKKKLTKPHERHYETTDSVKNVGDAMTDGAVDVLIEAINEETTLNGIMKWRALANAGLRDGDFTKEQHDVIEVAIKKRLAEIDGVKDACTKDSYQYDKKLKDKFYAQLTSGANADVPNNIKQLIKENGGVVEYIKVEPDKIVVEWHIDDFNARNDIYMRDLNGKLQMLAEDLAHAIFRREYLKGTTANDSKPVVKDSKPDKTKSHPHHVNIKTTNMNDIARLCDMFDEGNVKYEIKNDVLTIYCGDVQWKELTSRFKSLKD